MKIKNLLFCFVIISLVLILVILLSKINVLNQDIVNKEIYIQNCESVIEEKENETFEIKNYSKSLESKLTILEDETLQLTEELSEKDATISELFGYANLQVIKENHEIVESSWDCKNGKKMLYALYTPNGLDKDESLPLILYLHGSGQIGSNLRLLENCYDGFSTYVYDGRLAPDAYILMPQTPDGSWGAHTEDLMNLILSICEDYNVDKARISVTGHSLGGSGTVSMVCAYPDFFSAAAPLSSYVDKQSCKKLLGTPIWFFVGSNDNSGSYVNANDLINEDGGNSKITVYQNEGHHIPNHYLDNNCEIVNWLISQVNEK